LKQDKIEIITTRDDKKWTRTFAKYFEKDWKKIKQWTDKLKWDFNEKIKKENIVLPTPTIYHATAEAETAYRLYGISKYANENNVDLILHLHFNDYAYREIPVGDYFGFVIYAPDESLDNYKASQELAKNVFEKLVEKNPISNYKGEEVGVALDHELIALGAFNTLKAPSILIEYAYIYEPQLANNFTRDTYLKGLAEQTYQGIKSFLVGKK
jgi:N-acetylmuramoyl-L-alanine amidase